MVSNCVVPGCRSRRPNIKHFCVPFTNKVRWNKWLKACPFLRRYRVTQLENVRICILHFIPEHINERQKLSIDAIPSLNLSNVQDHTLNKHQAYLEIISSTNTPSTKEPYTFRVVRPFLHTNNPSVEQIKLTGMQTDNLSCDLNMAAHSSHTKFHLPTNTFQPTYEYEPTNMPSSTSSNKAICSLQTSPVCFINRNIRNSSQVNLTRKVRIEPKQITPRKQILRSNNRILKRKLRLLQLRYNKLKIKSVVNAPKTKMYLKKYNILSTFGKLLVDSQLRLTGISPKGRRFTNEEKIFSLSLYKLSPKCYRFLRKHLALPSKSTINSILSNIPLRPGINDFIFQHLSDAAKDKPALYKQCTLLFDEMSIYKNLYFNFHTGVIEGFEDLGSGKRTNNVADKALVFMLRGLFAPWKIPIAFYFARDGVKTLILKNIIKEVTSAIFNTGFIVRATVSDQGSANVATIKSLICDSNINLLHSDTCRDGNIYYCIGNNLLYHIYDVPHLLKGFRNNFQKKHLLSGDQRAQWQFIEMLYKVDGIGGRARSTKLTDKHIKPSTYDKMKVKLAAQVFSRQVSTSLEVYMKSLLYIQEHEYAHSNIDIESGLFTAEILLFVNNLFDSLNGFGFSGDKLQHALSLNSEHLEFWDTAVKKLDSMRFDSSNERESKPLSLKHFIHNIKSIKLLWTDLCSIDGVKFLSLRRLNQDPLENFFGQVRAHGQFSINPDCNHFVSAFKTLLINNITTGKSLYTNCANDDDKMLGTLENFVNRKKYGFHNDDIQPDISVHFIENVIPSENVLQNKTVSYIAGSICHYLIPNLQCKECENCKKALLSEKEPCHSLIELREYSSNVDRLFYPSKNLSLIVWQSIYIIDRMLPSICSVYIYSELIHSLEQTVDMKWYNCVTHKADFMKVFWLFVIRMQVKQWCINFNRRVHNVDSRPKHAEMETLIRTSVTKGFGYRSVRRRST